MLWSDAERIRRKVDCSLIGMSEIKRRRLEELQVDCHPGTHVGEYVPFYFSPRSVMLYILHRGNNPDLSYRGGQRPIVHLRFDLRSVVEWANDNGKRWAFSTSNAGAFLANFYDDLDDLSEIDWNAVRATDWRDPDIKEGKQSEFLVERAVHWKLIEEIGVIDDELACTVRAVIEKAKHKPQVTVHRGWYY